MPKTITALLCLGGFFRGEKKEILNPREQIVQYLKSMEGKFVSFPVDTFSVPTFESNKRILRFNPLTPSKTYGVSSIPLQIAKVQNVDADETYSSLFIPRLGPVQYRFLEETIRLMDTTADKYFEYPVRATDEVLYGVTPKNQISTYAFHNRNFEEEPLLPYVDAYQHSIILNRSIPTNPDFYSINISNDDTAIAHLLGEQIALGTKAINEYHACNDKTKIICR